MLIQSMHMLFKFMACTVMYICTKCLKYKIKIGVLGY